tara:strand:- start:182 stop:433 length:252 start_codon:yes stop_codon:yes gene_type:complete
MEAVRIKNERCTYQEWKLYVSRMKDVCITRTLRKKREADVNSRSATEALMEAAIGEEVKLLIAAARRVATPRYPRVVLRVSTV